MSSEQIKQFKHSADTLFKQKDYTSATILYFKTWFAVQDDSLQNKIGRSPKDHTERFRLLEKHFPEAYDALDREFTTYRDTYTRIIDYDTCLRIKQLVEKELRNHLSS